MNAFEVTDAQAKPVSDGPTQEQFEAILTQLQANKNTAMELST